MTSFSLRARRTARVSIGITVTVHHRNTNMRGGPFDTTQVVEAQLSIHATKFFYSLVACFTVSNQTIYLFISSERTSLLLFTILPTFCSCSSCLIINTVSSLLSIYSTAYHIKLLFLCMFLVSYGMVCVYEFLISAQIVATAGWGLNV